MLLNVPVFCEDFAPSQYPQLQGELSCQFTPDELTWAAFTVGKKSDRLFEHGWHSLFELQWRRYMLYAFLQKSDDRIVQSPAFHALDPSEKTAISYFLGLTMAKLVAEKYLGGSFLLHLDIFDDFLQCELAPGAPQINGQERGRNQLERPDLIGRDSMGQWYSMEAKGRSGALDGKAMKTAKDQATKLISVQGTAPHLKIGLQAFFRASGLSVKWQDPPETEKYGWSLPVEDTVFFTRYYEVIAGMVRNSNVSEIVNERAYRMVAVPETDVLLGLDEEVLNALNGERTWREVSLELHDRANTTQRGEETLKFGSDFTRGRSSNPAIGGDGVLVHLGEPDSESLSKFGNLPPYWWPPVICRPWPAYSDFFASMERIRTTLLSFTIPKSAN